MPIETSDGDLKSCVEGKSGRLGALPDMSALLHLYLVPSGDEFLVEGDIGDPMGDTLADDFKRVEAAGNDIPSEVDSSLDNPDCSLDGPLDEAF